MQGAEGELDLNAFNIGTLPGKRVYGW